MGKNMTIDRVKIEIDKCRQNISGYEEALKHLPIESVLGRWSIECSIKHEMKKLNKLNKELSLLINKQGGNSQ